MSNHKALPRDHSFDSIPCKPSGTCTQHPNELMKEQRGSW